MGVAGSGKTTVGTALAAALGWRFVDADDHHAAASVAKMARGEPLDDADRWPWLDRLRAIIAAALAADDAAGAGVLGAEGRYRARLAAATRAGACASFTWRERPSCCARGSPRRGPATS